MPQITIVQVLRREGLDYAEIINRNKTFFDSLNSGDESKIEYIVYDNLKSFNVLKFIKNIVGVKYFRKTFLNVKHTFIEAVQLASSEKIIFLKSDDILNLKNVEHLEKIRPGILKLDLLKIKKIKHDDFNYDDFNLLIKDKKSLWEKIKLVF
jgi:hypothetical protein